MSFRSRLTQSDLDAMVTSLVTSANTLITLQIPLVCDLIAALGADGMTALPPGDRAIALTTAEANNLINAMNELYCMSQNYRRNIRRLLKAWDSDLI